MSSFDNFYTRLQSLNEARKSPVEALVPGATGVTKQMRSAGLSSAPLDTIRFIRELLFNLDVISEEELNVVKIGKGFTGKKQAMLKVLQDNQDAINAKSDEIAQRIESTLDDFISGMGANRSREEKYAAQAAAQELAAQARAAKSGKEMDDALADVISDEKLIIKASLAKAIQELEDLPGGEDISPDVLSEIKKFAPKIDTLEQLESFVKQLSAMEEYQLPAAYLSSTVKAIKGGMEDIEMEDQEDPDHGFDANKSDLDGDGNISKYERKRGEAIASSMSKEDNEGIVKREVLDACKAAAGDFAHKNSGMAFGCKQMLDQYTKAGDTERASIAKSLHDHFSGQAKHFDENGEEPDIEALAQVEVEELGDGELPDDYHEDAEQEIKVGSMLTTNYNEVVHVDKIDTESDMKGRPIYYCTDKDGGEHVLYPEQVLAVSPEDGEGEHDDNDGEEERCDYVPCEDGESVSIKELGLNPALVRSLAEDDGAYDGTVGSLKQLINNKLAARPDIGVRGRLQQMLKQLGETPDEVVLSENVIIENKNTTGDSLLDIYTNIKPIVETIVESTTINENGQTSHTQQYLVEKREEAIEQVYTNQYLTEQKASDSLLVPKDENNQTFKERYQPKTSYQLEELRRYGL